jgi:hypothetical protein
MADRASALFAPLGTNVDIQVECVHAACPGTGIFLAADAVLFCLPTDLVCELATDLLRYCTPIVEAATLESIARQVHWREIDRVALRRGVPAVVRADWDPGVHPLFERPVCDVVPEGRHANARSARRQPSPHACRAGHSRRS